MADMNFFTALKGRISSLGTRNDPSGKEGLAAVVSESFRRGTSNYPNPQKLFMAIESLGAIFNVNADRDSFVFSVRAPDEKIEDANELLTEIIRNTQTDESRLMKIKAQALMAIDELESDPRSFAVTEFMNLVLEQSSPFGNKAAIKKLKLRDVYEFREKLVSSLVDLEVAGVDEVSGEVFSVEKGVPIIRKGELKMINREIPQKVVMMGFPMKGFAEYDYGVAAVARRILYDGLVGLVPEKIREENSAAYYAYSLSSLFAGNGVFYSVAGVNEGNVVLALKLMRDIYGDVVDGKFKKSRIKSSKEKSKSVLDQIMDDPEALYSFYAMWQRNGMEPPKYEEIIEKFQAVTKKDIVDYYKSIVDWDRCCILINGKVPKKTKSKVEEIFND